MASRKLAVILNGARHEVEPGKSLKVLRGTPHYFRNEHDGDTLLTVRFRPAQQFLRFFLNMSLSTANHPEWYDARGEPPLLLRALALHAYAGHGYAAGIPVWFQKALFAALSPVAILKGYRLAVAPRARPEERKRNKSSARPLLRHHPCPLAEGERLMSGDATLSNAPKFNSDGNHVPLRIDPKYGRAHALLAWCHALKATYLWAKLLRSPDDRLRVL